MKSLILIAILAAGCGKEIGDSCVLATDCDVNGTRTCDLSQKGGYCTIQGCDYASCPSEAVCVRFFMGTFDSQTCDPSSDAPTCTPDELCALTGHCALRSTEVRYCMRKCKDDGDCRDGYECRTLAEMKRDGGEPVLKPGEKVDASSPKFCAIAPAKASGSGS
jgi:hypothetical protein